MKTQPREVILIYGLQNLQYASSCSYIQLFILYIWFGLLLFQNKTRLDTI